ncbi:MAG: F0F1 ATP synthase subunit epsilon [Candidatus Pacebacteria bacterium]|nr:F0F1 ATP synthase subunit epsilon [Candidatus Paceibacterota bacterium]
MILKIAPLITKSIMHVGVYTIKDTLFNEEATKVIAKTTTGEITILPDHLPIVSTLVPGILRIFEKNGVEKTIEIKSGVLEIRPESKIVILASA